MSENEQDNFDPIAQELAVDQDTHSFIVRIWDEPHQVGNPPQNFWRGSIIYVGSDKRLYFDDLNSIANFIREQVRADGPQAVARWETLVNRSKVGRRMRAAWLLFIQRVQNFLHRLRRPD